MFANKSTGEAEKSRIIPASRSGRGLVMQRKLEIGSVNDPMEHEADAVADKVMRMPEPPLLQRKCTGCREEEKALQKKELPVHASGSQSSELPPVVHEVLNSSGHPLDTSTRTFMETRFGHDFGTVRVHNDAKAAESARSVNAAAYTVGSDVVFGAGQYAPHATAGQRLMAHELTHVVQQRQSTVPRRQHSFGDEGYAGMEANSFGDRMAGSGLNNKISEQSGPSFQRKVAVDNPKALIPNPTGKGLVQTNAQTVEVYLQTLCSEGTVSVDKASGIVSIASGFCPTPMPPGVAGPVAPAPADKSKEPKGCNCLCDMVGSSKDYTIVVNDADWPHTSGRVVTAPSPNSPSHWGAATVSGKAAPIDPWLVLGHELCGHAWLSEKGLPDNNANRGEGGHQEAVARENELRSEHGIEARGSFKDPYCGESFSQDKTGPGPVVWSSYLKTCEAWRKKNYGSKYNINDKIP